LSLRGGVQVWKSADGYAHTIRHSGLVGAFMAAVLQQHKLRV
jgi:hypothetical protein